MIAGAGARHPEFRNFADRVIAATRRLGPLCVGFDPYPDRMSPLFGPPGPAAITAFGRALVECCAGRVAAVKPQISLFERFGASGIEALAGFCDAAHRAGLLVILDAKRGDIGPTARAYAEAWLGPAPVLHADCVTVNPLMGRDSFAPFVEAALHMGKGVAMLVRTSNPGGADIFDAMTPDGPVWMRIARLLASAEAQLRGESGWSSLMAVMGATVPAEARRLREILPHALILAPGYGAQGAKAGDALAGFVAGPKHADGRIRPEGGLVNASRSVLFPAQAEKATTIPAWQALVAEAIDAAQADLAAAVV